MCMSVRYKMAAVPAGHFLCPFCNTIKPTDQLYTHDNYNMCRRCVRAIQGDHKYPNVRGRQNAVTVSDESSDLSN